MPQRPSCCADSDTVFAISDDIRKLAECSLSYARTIPIGLDIRLAHVIASAMDRLGFGTQRNELWRSLLQSPQTL